MRLIILAFATAISLVSCGGVRKQEFTQNKISFSQTTASDIITFHKTCMCVVSELKMRVKPKGKDSIIFDAVVSVDVSGECRLTITKLDYPVLQAVITTGGDYQLVHWHEKWVSKGKLSELFDAGEHNPRLLVFELLHGPLYKLPSYAFQKGDKIGGVDPATGCFFLVTFNGVMALQKDYYLPSPYVRMLTVLYSEYRELQGFMRPTKAKISGLAIPQETEWTVGIRYFNELPEIPSKKLFLKIPADYEKIPAESVKERLFGEFIEADVQ